MDDSEVTGIRVGVGRALSATALPRPTGTPSSQDGLGPMPRQVLEAYFRTSGFATAPFRQETKHPAGCIGLKRRRTASKSVLDALPAEGLKPRRISYSSKTTDRTDFGGTLPTPKLCWKQHLRNRTANCGAGRRLRTSEFIALETLGPLGRTWVWLDRSRRCGQPS